jgi:hypothetical protein
VEIVAVADIAVADTVAEIAGSSSRRVFPLVVANLLKLHALAVFFGEPSLV